MNTVNKPWIICLTVCSEACKVRSISRLVISVVKSLHLSHPFDIRQRLMSDGHL